MPFPEQGDRTEWDRAVPLRGSLYRDYSHRVLITTYPLQSAPSEEKLAGS